MIDLGQGMSIPDHIEPMLRRAIDEARAEGWTIVRGTTLDTKTKCCCVIGALVRVRRQSLGLYEVAAKRIGALRKHVRDIANGFDEFDEAKPIVDPDYYALGRRLWAYAESTR